jgi:hypothetical protein
MRRATRSRRDVTTPQAVFLLTEIFIVNLSDAMLRVAALLRQVRPGPQHLATTNHLIMVGLQMANSCEEPAFVFFGGAFRSLSISHLTMAAADGAPPATISA